MLNNTVIQNLKNPLKSQLRSQSMNQLMKR